MENNNQKAQEELNPISAGQPKIKIRKSAKKSKIKKRVSNRRYPFRYCKKADCNEKFIPTDSRQLYCSEQHRIDYNNDKRKEIDKVENNFTKTAKKNRAILIKIVESKEYDKSGYIHISLLEYEGFDFAIFHEVKTDTDLNREVKFCYEYGILLLDTEKQNFKIKKK